MRDVELPVGDLFVDDRRVKDDAIDQDDQNAPLVLGGNGAEVDLALMVEVQADVPGGIGLYIDEIALRDFWKGTDLDRLAVGRQLNGRRLRLRQAFPRRLDMDAQKDAGLFRVAGLRREKGEKEKAKEEDRGAHSQRYEAPSRKAKGLVDGLRKRVVVAVEFQTGSVGSRNVILPSFRASPKTRTMRRTLCLLLCLILVVTTDVALAIDISPSKDTVPRGTWDTGGNRFSIFNGDPKRIQRANAVDPKAFDAKLEVTPNPLSLKAAKTVGPNPSIKVTFSVHNHAKKTFTLSFPTTQRWDFRILNAAGTLVYSYTDDHEFLQTVGSSMVNNDDKLVYPESVDFNDMATPLVPGVYTVQAILANYPEINAQVQLTVLP